MNLQFKLALRYLSGRKMRTVLTTLSIVFGVMVIFGLNGMLPAVAGSFRQNIMTSSNQVDLTITSEARGVFDDSVKDVVSGMPGVAHVTGSLVRTLILPPAQAPKAENDQPISTFMLNGLDPASVSEVRPLMLKEGRFLEVEDGNVVLIWDDTAQKTRLGLGDTLRLPSASGTTGFEIIGIVIGRPTIGAENIYVPLAAAQELLNTPRQINTIEALFVPGSDVEAVRQAVLDDLGSGYKLGGIEVAPEVRQFMDMGDSIFTMFGVLALAMGGFIIFNTFRTVVVERRRDIGMLRAVGASRRTIQGLILTESVLQGVLGTAIGLAAGYLFVVGLLALMAPIWEQRVGFSLGEPSFSLQTYVLSIGLGVGVTVLSGWLPARSASRVSPLEALRPSMGETSWKVARRRALWGVGLIIVALLGLISGNTGLSSLGVVLFLTGLVLVAPALIQPISKVFGRLLALAFAREGQIARGNLARQPGRSAVTASAMMIGLAVVVGVIGMVTSLTTGVYGFVDQSMGADFLLMPQSQLLGGGNVGADPQFAQSIQEAPGIAAVTSLRASTTQVDGVDLQVVGIDPASYPVLSGIEFSAGDPEQVYAALSTGRTLIANDLYAAQNQVEAGQELTLQTPEGPQSYRVVGTGSDYMNQKLATAYISHANLDRDFHATSDLLIMANQEDGADPAEVEASLRDLVQDYPAFSLFAFQEWRENLTKESNAKLGALYVVVGALAIPSLIALVNTLGINVLERTREIGVLRAVGATRRQVRRMIMAESLLLAAAGTAFGILSGVWLGYILVAALNMTGFVLPYFFPYAGILTTVAVGLLFGVLGALIPARHAARLNIVTALQYE